jgi:hypothetical protein
VSVVPGLNHDASIGQQPGGPRENHFQLTHNRISARRLHQQQQPAAAGEDDGRGSRKFRHDGSLPGWHQAALQLICPISILLSYIDFDVRYLI